METLTSRQMKMTRTLADWASKHAKGPVGELLVDETFLATQMGDDAWRRGNIDDLKAILSFCAHDGYPPLPLIVVIPGLGKPEKPLMTHAFKATLSASENTKRWNAALDEIRETPAETWQAIIDRVSPEE